MSIRMRLALFGLAVVAVTLVSFILVFYGLFAAAGSGQQDKQLAERAAEAVQALAVATADDFRPRRVLAPVDPATAIDIFVIVLGPDGAPLSGTGEIDGFVPGIPAEVLAAADAGKPLATIEPRPGVRLRVYMRPWSRPDLGLSGHVAAAQSTRRVENDLSAGMAFLIVAAVFAFFIAAGAIWLVIGRALRPLKQLAVLTDEVGRTQDLSRRLPVPRAHDDVRRLSESFNGMMERLEDAYSRLAGALESQKRFVADASHELRTPLTTIRSNAGFLIGRPEAREEDRLAALHDIAGESERMSRLVHDLLLLARADAGQHLERSPVDLRALVRDVCRQARNLHPGREVRDSAADMTVVGNEDALKQLLWILIDNAVRHTGQGGLIRVALEPRGVGARLSVEDDGEGIPADQLPHIFDRFYRADAARSNGGAGLGLSIATWIVGEHEGSITAHNNPARGATILVDLPLARAADVETGNTPAQAPADEPAPDQFAGDEDQPRLVPSSPRRNP